MENKAFKRNVRALREDMGISQEKLGELLGVAGATVSKWETLGRSPKAKEIKNSLKSVFNCTDEDLFGYSDGYYSKTRGGTSIGVRASNTFLPVAGLCPAGEPSEAIEQSGITLWCPPEYAMDGNFYVKVNGDSMDRVLPNNSYALIDTTREVISGDIALVKVNGDEATIKRVRIVDGVIFLEPESTNPVHRRRVIDETDPDAPAVRLLGRVVFASVAVNG